MPARTYPSNNSASLWHLVASAERVSQDSSTALSAAKGPSDEERTDSMNALIDSVAVHNRLLAAARETVPNPPAADVESFEYNIHVASTYSGVSYLRGFADGIYNWDIASAEVSRWLACVWRCLVHESPDIKLVYDCLSLFTYALRSLEKPGTLSRHKFSDLSCYLRVETAVCDIYDVDEHLESHIVWIWRDLIVSSVAHDGALGATVLINNRISEYGYGKLVADRIRNPGQDLDELWDGHWSQAMIDAGQELKP
ncbi:uncharacterized protein EV420DRAFT_1640017 [Desarmillaria tabescens]|uniref:Uncharacterized protein n=1 Tax=Armillaria tabescens TaxID=1929756 RepID=A0AA39TJW3_ARMTA|nr:uncharacterized protein EV420DRAFT_1640017 [Desarmillaria tabescens]KAK0461712.1 hypothetical protein EV420DRAFT_1640017 [Desarmillaria tabescens]